MKQPRQKRNQTMREPARSLMQTEIWQIVLADTLYEVQVTYKQMKNIRLRVLAGGQICLSAPPGTDRQWLEQFLAARADWLLQNIEKMSKKLPAEKQPPLTDAERKQTLAYLQPIVDEFYPIVAEYGIPKPHVTVRRMRTRFGTCSVNRARITLSTVLLTVPRPCAEYVVLHELSHFLYPNHSREFYDFLGKYMPDWKDRERQLRQID